MAFCWPFLAPGATQSSGVAHGGDAMWVFAAVLPLLLFVVLTEMADGGIDAKAIALLGVLAAAGAALRTVGGDVDRRISGVLPADAGRPGARARVRLRAGRAHPVRAAR